MQINDLSPIGFGSYRISGDDNAHRLALEHALREGCNIVDTSSNYKSEVLIGEVIKATGINPFLITKAGYLNQKDLHLFDPEKHQITFLKDDIVHSIHPDVIKLKIEESLSKLGVKSIDAFLLHNPEYYLQSENARQDVFYDRIRQAFEFLEGLVEEGTVRSYGLSSNTMISEPGDQGYVDLSRIVKISKKIGINNNFKFIQFPLNLFETGALKKRFGELNLIAYAKNNSLKILSNRPLTAVYNKAPFKLVNYNISSSKQIPFANHYRRFVESIRDYTSDAFLSSVPFTSFQRNLELIKSEIELKDFNRNHLLPTLEKVFESKIPAPVVQEVQSLMEGILLNIKTRIDNRSNKIKDDVFGSNNPESLQILCCKRYLEWGVDHILLGMRNIDYHYCPTKIFKGRPF
jgi:aryl-alcohol dehydrogenase-like predicted oxidoreductase